MHPSRAYLNAIGPAARRASHVMSENHGLDLLLLEDGASVATRDYGSVTDCRPALAVQDLSRISCLEALRDRSMARKSQIGGKTARPSLTGILPRPRLFRLLDRGGRPLTWVQGPPGAGKTTLVASYLEARRARALWYRLHESDADLASFFYFLGLAATGGARRRPLPLLTPEYLGGISAFSRHYFVELFRRLQSPFLIVLDDYHAIPPDSPFHEIVRELVDQLPTGCRVLVASRTAPNAALARLLASGAISVVGWEELRLTAPEASGIVRRRIRRPTPQMLRALQETTQGWAAGLVLLVERGNPGSLSTGSGASDPGALFDYFAGEIFDKTDRDTQEILLQTAFFPRTTAAMAEALTGSKLAGAVLAGLARANYFTVRHAEGEPFYEYHPLFRTFLLAKARAAWSPDRRRQVQRAAGLLLESAGQVEEAFDLLKDAGDWTAAVRIVLQQASLLLAHGRAQTLEVWLRSLPSDVLDQSPWLPFWLGACRLAANPLEAREHFVRAFAKFEKDGIDTAGMFLAWAGVVDTFVYAWDDFTALDRWIEILETRLSVEASFPSPEIEARVVFGMFTALMYRQPQHPDLPRWAERAMTVALGSPHVQVRMMIAHQLLLYYNWWAGDLGKATVLVERLRPLSRAPNIDPLARIVWKSIEATYHWMTASHRACLKAVGEGLETAKATGIHLWDFMLCAQGVWGSLIAGDVQTAISHLETMALALNPAHGMHATLYHDTAGILALWRGNLPGALEHGRTALDRAIRTGMPFAQAMCNLTTGRALMERGDGRAGAEHLARTREIGRSMRDPYIEYLCLFTEGKAALDAGDQPRGLEALRQAMALAKAQGFWTHMWMPTPTLSRLCATALEHDIEVDYVRELIVRRGLDPPPDVAAENWPWPVRIKTLGQFTVSIHDRPLRFNRKAQKKPLALLKAIISLGGRDVREETLMDALWPQAEGDAAARALTTTLHRLRRLLGHDVLSRQEGRLGVEDRRCWIDVWALEQCLAQTAMAESSADRDRWLERATALYRGPFLAGETEPWTAPLRERLQRRFGTFDQFQAPVDPAKAVPSTERSWRS